MKQQIIRVTSLPNSTQVEIQNGHKRFRPRQFAGINEALKFVSPRGSRRTRLYLNGYPCVLHGWVQ
jgi:hypothetical protein